MSRILVPYHLDEHLPGLEVPVAPDTTVGVDALAGDGPWQRMGDLYQRVADLVADDVRAGGRPTVLSGDCTTSLATVAGLQRAGVDAGVVWFDAHGDVQSLETTTSGYLGGMPLRMLVGYRPELIAESLGLRPVAEDRVVLVDARDLDPPEIEFLADSAIGRAGVYELTADDVPAGPLYVHVDLDVVDPSDLPGLLFPAPGGPGLEAVFTALRRLLDTGRVAALGLGCTWRSGSGSAERLRPYLDDLVYE